MDLNFILDPNMFFSSRRRHTRFDCDWSSDVCSSDLTHWLPAPIDLTPAEKAAIPPTALALGVVLFVSAACVVAGALIRRPRAVIAGYAMEIGRASCRERV